MVNVEINGPKRKKNGQNWNDYDDEDYMDGKYEYDDEWNNYEEYNDSYEYDDSYDKYL